VFISQSFQTSLSAFPKSISFAILKKNFGRSSGTSVTYRAWIRVRIEMEEIMKRIASTLIIIGMLGLAVTNCTRHPSDEQLQVLTETKAAAEAAEQKIEDLKSEKSDLGDQVTAKKAELDKANAEKDRAEATK